MLAQGSRPATRIEVLAPSTASLPGDDFARISAGGAESIAPRDLLPGDRRLIVRLREDVSDPAREADDARRELGARGDPSARVDRIYAHALKGYAITLPAPAVEAFLRAAARNPRVAAVEFDELARIEQATLPTWNLDRIDQRDLPLDQVFDPGRTGASGLGVRAYVVDSGILDTHIQLRGRVLPGYSSVDDGRGTTDCNGHGTHVSATIGSPAWGVARDVSLVPVRVLGCDGTGPWSDILAGLDWIAANAQRPALVNLSLGGNVSSSVDQAVARLVSLGIPVVVAAGNRSADACLQSPGREPQAITVAASNPLDERTASSNWGSCIDLFAPGASITSAWISSETAQRTLSGTSMAAPHVSGALALMLERNPDASPADLQTSLKRGATAGRLAWSMMASPNLLLFLHSTLSVGSPAPVSNREVSIGSLTGVGVPVTEGWVARVTIGVRDSDGSPIGGATVAGRFTTEGVEASCITDLGGLCSVFSQVLPLQTGSTFYTVLGVSGSDLVYSPSSDLANPR